MTTFVWSAGAIFAIEAIYSLYRLTEIPREERLNRIAEVLHIATSVGMVCAAALCLLEA